MPRNAPKTASLPLWSARCNWRREYNKTRNELASLSDRSLADLGISRGEITAISRKAVYGYQS